MILSIFSVFIIFGVIFCDIESSEWNQLDINPLFDTIIYKDIADIINDFENNGFPKIDIFENSESQSDSSVEDLLTEYQHYLDKAQRQREKYKEKSKFKTKLPLLRHEPYSKLKPRTDNKHNDYYYRNNLFNAGSLKLPLYPLERTLDIFMPLHSKVKYNKHLGTTIYPPKGNNKTLIAIEKGSTNELKTSETPVLRKSSPIETTCFCKSSRLPHNCKECFVPADTPWPHNSVLDNTLNHQDYISRRFKDMFSDNKLNVRIKIDLQVPNMQDSPNFDTDHIISKELSTAFNLPFPIFNFPTTMDRMDFKKFSKPNTGDSTSMQKLAIHKKKKFRPSNTNKRHRKKFMGFHDLQLQSTTTTDSNNNEMKYNNNSNIRNETTAKPDNVLNLKNNATNNQSSESIKTLSVDYIFSSNNNSRNKTISATEDTPTSINTDSPKNQQNVTTITPTRKKRDLMKIIHNTAKENDSIDTSSARIDTTKEISNIKKHDKILNDAELLYWPNNSNKNKINKINISKETRQDKNETRHNHPEILDEALFGAFDWNNINTVAAVAPALISFVGKYLRGVVTFCPQEVCLSVNCDNKSCLHRVCHQADRFNNKGHCQGISDNENTAHMGNLFSIRDLPSNIVFGAVDVILNKMLGKMFGKATLCINNKCVTLVASKKQFAKYLCNNKELNSIGHCDNAKNVKVIPKKLTM